MRGSVLIQDLEYADDMALVSDSMGTLEEVLRSLASVCSGVGLSISSKKTKILAVLPSPSPCPPPHPVSLKPWEQPVAVVEEFEYLGSMITKDCTLDREVNVHISKASRTFGSLYRVLWSRNNIKNSTKMHLFKSVVLATLLYGSGDLGSNFPPAEETTVLHYVVPASDPGGVQMGPEKEYRAPRDGRY